ncbi:MAG: hypothetical protein JNM55_10370 [Anaerolineales bacterium]|nr:hypothetical protein [Anaerolineales bacterium]
MLSRKQQQSKIDEFELRNSSIIYRPFLIGIGIFIAAIAFGTLTKKIDIAYFLWALAQQQCP